MIEVPTGEPIDFLSLGMGVQSSELGMKAARGELLRLGYRVRAAIFSDTQAEPDEVYEWVDILKEYIASQAHPFPVYVVSHGNLTTDSLKVIRSRKSGNLYQKNLIPLFMLQPNGKKGILQRKCTSEYKIRAIQRKQKELLGKDVMNAWRRENKVKLAMWSAHVKEVKASHGKLAYKDPKQDFGIPPLCRTLIGISTDEVQRVKGAREPWTENSWPLLELGMDRKACQIDQIMEIGRPAPRSACVYCPYHSDEEWLRIKAQPKEWQKVVKFDRELRESNAQDEVTTGKPYLHDSRMPIDQVVFQPKRKKEGDDFEAHCEAEGMCGL